MNARIHIPHIGGQQEHSHQSLFFTILTGGQLELFSRLLTISSGSKAKRLRPLKCYYNLDNVILLPLIFTLDRTALFLTN